MSNAERLTFSVFPTFYPLPFFNALRSTFYALRLVLSQPVRCLENFMWYNFSEAIHHGTFYAPRYTLYVPRLTMIVQNEHLKEFLIDSGLVSKDAVAQAEAIDKEKKIGLGKVLVTQGKISEDDLRRSEAYILGIPFVGLKGQKRNTEY